MNWKSKPPLGMLPCSLLLAAACIVLSGLVASQDVELPTGYSTGWSSPSWWAEMNDPVKAWQNSQPVAIGYNTVFTLNANSTITGWLWRQRGAKGWVSNILPGLNTSLPNLVTEGPPGLVQKDTVYLLNTADGRLYAYEPAVNRRGPLWRSNFVCSRQEPQQLQWVTPNSAAGVVAAHCGSDMVVANIATGRLIKRFPNKAAHPAFAIPFVGTGAVASFSGRRVAALPFKSTAAAWAVSVPDPGYRISSMASGGNLLVTTGANSPTMYFIASNGTLLSSISIGFNNTPANANIQSISINPRPTLMGGVVYGVAQGYDTDVFGELPPKPYFVMFAVNVTNPSAPRIQWQQVAQKGQPKPQPLIVSKNNIYVSHQNGGTVRNGGRITFESYLRSNGAYAWHNSPFMSPWPPSVASPAVANAPYCCEQMFLTGNHLSAWPNGTRSHVWVLNLQFTDGPATPIERCYCTP